jgi:hypothetical protein
MPQPKSRLFTYIAAGSLTALTLVTFFLLRNYGPDKAVWRFHDAALANDQLEIARVTMQSPTTLSVQVLEAFVRDAQKGKIRVVTEHETTTEATFSILYQLPQNPNRTLMLNWVVVNTEPAGWVIDASKTISSSPDFRIFVDPRISPVGLGHFFGQRTVLG